MPFATSYGVDCQALALVVFPSGKVTVIGSSILLASSLLYFSLSISQSFKRSYNNNINMIKDE